MTNVRLLLNIWHLRARHRPVQLWAKELLAVALSISAHPRCRLLVFGVGNDAPIWLALNKTGETAFLENDATWIAEIGRRVPRADIVLVEYQTRLAKWREQLDSQQTLRLALPDRITSRQWDVIVVDGPLGDPGKPGTPVLDDRPGRGSSVYSAAQLVAAGGDIFVHDCERECEAAYSQRYLGNLHVMQDVWGRALLRHFRAPLRPPSG